MKISYKAMLTCKLDPRHPDAKYIIGGYSSEKEYEFSDRYTFDMDIWPDKEDRVAYMKRDLALCAGGGYTTEHIHSVKFAYWQD